MAIEVLGSGQPDGTSIVKSTTEKVALYGGTAVSQADSAVSLITSANAFSQTNVELDLINDLVENLAQLGIIASA